MPLTMLVDGIHSNKDAALNFRCNNNIFESLCSLGHCMMPHEERKGEMFNHQLESESCAGILNMQMAVLCWTPNSKISGISVGS